MSGPYPTRSQIAAIFKAMEDGNYPEFMKHVSLSVDWTVMGSYLPPFSSSKTPQLKTDTTVN